MNLLPTKDSFRFVWKSGLSKKEHPGSIISDSAHIGESKSEDDNKRSFLKLASIAGLGLIASQVLPKKAEAYVLGSTPTSNVIGVKNIANTRIDPATEGGNLATVKTNTDPLVASGAGGFVRQDSTGTIAKETGGNLAAIKANSDKFLFDVSGNLLTAGAGGGSASEVGLKDSGNVRVNPATEDAIVYLRRMVKLMESQATVDAGNRQRITIDSLGTGTAVTTTIPVSGTVTATVSSAAISTMAGQNQQMFQDVARNTYANGIRQNLIFS